KANANGGRDNVTVVVVDVLQGVDPTAEQVELESEPGWPDSEATGTMIDADASSAVSAPGVIVTETGEVVPPVIVQKVDPASTSGKSSGWGVRRFLKLVAAAAALTLIIVFIAVAVHNGNNSDPSPTTVVTTESDTAVSTPAPTTTRAPTTTVSSSVAATTVVATSTSGP
ncbi:MAG TPA: hypothetical protein VIK05_01055, partial [Ilumatobacteraceae bacterium]